MLLSVRQLAAKLTELPEEQQDLPVAIYSGLDEGGDLVDTDKPLTVITRQGQDPVDAGDTDEDDDDTDDTDDSSLYYAGDSPFYRRDIGDTIVVIRDCN